MKALRWEQVGLVNLRRWLGAIDPRWVVAVAIASGMIFRIAQYAANRSLWFDEVYLAIHILHQPFPELLHPLADNRGGAPFLFLLVERFFVMVAGTSDYSLRFFPLLSGIASIVLFYPVARNLLAGWNLALAVTLFAISDPLIYYSSELKQYPLDVFAALLIYYFALRAYRSRLAWIDLMCLFLVGAISVWLSDPAVFILAGVGICLAIAFLRSRRILFLCGVFVLWMLSFSANYYVHLRNLADNSVLQGVWEDYFVPFSLFPLGAIKWAAVTLPKSISFLFPSTSGLVIELTVLLGIISVYSKKIVWFLLAPIFLALFASALHVYPFYQRFLLFALPALILLVTLGIDYLHRSLGLQNAKLATYFLVALVTLPQFFGAVIALKNPRTHEEMKPVVQYFLSHRLRGDSQYVYYSAQAPFEYYLDQLGSPLPYTLGIESRDNWMGYLQDLSKLRGSGRVWVLFSHVLRSEGVDEEILFVQYLSSNGVLLDSYHSDGASVYLFDVK